MSELFRRLRVFRDAIQKASDKAAVNRHKDADGIVVSRVLDAVTLAIEAAFPELREGDDG